MKTSTPPKSIQIAFTWGFTIMISFLPDILFREITGSIPGWLYWLKIGLLVAGIFASLVIKPLRTLWLFMVIVLAVHLFSWGVERFFQNINYVAWYSGLPPLLRDLFMVQIPRVTTSVLLVLFLLLLTGKFQKFFLVAGKLDAPAEPIPWILTRPPSWRILGPAIALAMPLGLVVFILIFGSGPSLQSLRYVLPLIPFVFLFAASNAFGEEILYRAPWLAALENPIGRTQALLLTSLYFGIAHFYGVPYGITGVIMAFIPGWLMGKSMYETRGFFWAWFIHFCMDATIFFFMALGSVAPGGS